MAGSREGVARSPAYGESKGYRTLRVAVQRWLLLCGAAGFLGAGPCGSSGAHRSGGAFGAGVVRCVALMPSYGCQPAISHVIPRWLIQILNLHRWNCNVFGASRKMTAINYVRYLSGGGVGAARFGRPRCSLRSARWLVVQPGPAAHGCRGPRALQPGLPISPVPRPGPAVPPAPSMPVAVGVLQH